MVGILLFVAHGFRKRAAAFFLPKTDRHAQRVFLVGSSSKNRKRFVLPPKTTATKRLVLPPKKVAKLTAPRSRFGWVFFEEPPTQKADKQEVQSGIPTTTDGDLLTVKRAQATEETPKKLEATHTKPIKKVAKQAEEKPLALAKNADKQDDKPIERVTKPPQTKENAAVTTVTKQPAVTAATKQMTTAPINTPNPKPVEAKADEPPTKELSVEDRIERIKSIQAAITGGGNMPAPVTTPHTESPSEEGKLAPTTTIAQDGAAEGTAAPHIRGATQHEGKPMPKRNLIALTKGFIEKWDGENGTDLVDRDGDASIKASLDEMRVLSYESKITWCLQAAWKQNFCYRSTRQIPEGDAIIEFTIDEHGNVTNSVLLQSSGHAELDAAIMKTTKYANPFPPLPHHLGTKQYTTGRIIQVRSHKYSF
jgi:TonB family protein